jgi:N-acetylated-alpha-linked acidic dipeptidase
MRHSLLLLTGFLAPSLACEREFKGNYFDFEFSGNTAEIEGRAAERFPPVWTKEEEILHTSFDNVELETWASYYTHGDHIAGRNKSMAEETAKKWTANGVPSSVVEYEVFLNYPVMQSLVLNLPNGTKHEAQMFEDKVEEDDTTNDPKSIPAFLGYSASGEVEAEYIYVGYAFGPLAGYALM